MSKFTFNWFIEQSRMAQKSVEEWPSVMQENIVLAAATLPRLGEARHEKPTQISAEAKPSRQSKGNQSGGN